MMKTSCGCSLGKVHVAAQNGVGATENVVCSITRAFAGSGGKHGSGDIFERCGERTGRKLPYIYRKDETETVSHSLITKFETKKKKITNLRQWPGPLLQNL